MEYLLKNIEGGLKSSQYSNVITSGEAPTPPPKQQPQEYIPVKNTITPTQEPAPTQDPKNTGTTGNTGSTEPVGETIPINEPSNDILNDGLGDYSGGGYGGGGGGGGMPPEEEIVEEAPPKKMIFGLKPKLFYGLLALATIGGFFVLKNKNKK